MSRFIFGHAVVPGFVGEVVFAYGDGSVWHETVIIRNRGSGPEAFDVEAVLIGPEMS